MNNKLVSDTRSCEPLAFYMDWELTTVTARQFSTLYSQRNGMTYHCDGHITHLSDTDIFFVLFNLFTYFEYNPTVQTETYHDKSL